jgi:hypothetical protein
MRTTKEACEQSIEERLGTTAEKVDDIVAKARHARDHARARVSGRVDSLRAHEARTRTQLRELREADQAGWEAAAVELHLELDHLEIEMAIAEARLDSDLASDDAAFAAAVEAELDAWNTHIDALQVRAATTSHHARAQREAAIRQVRERRAAAKGKLQTFQKRLLLATPAERSQLCQAMDELDRAAEEAAASFY